MCKIQILSDCLIALFTNKLILAFIAGFTGSAAYISILYFNFLGKSKAELSQILLPFYKKTTSDLNLIKVCLYCSIGGAIAIIFQYPEKTFVSVQSFLLGVTWPSIVTQHVSGRQKSLNQEEQEEIKEAQKILEPNQDAISKVPTYIDQSTRILDEIPKKVNKKKL